MALGIVWRDRIQSIKQAKQAKLPRQYNCCVPGGTATIVVVRHFCLEFELALPLETIPSAFALLIPTQVPTRFGNLVLYKRISRERLWVATREEVFTQTLFTGARVSPAGEQPSSSPVPARDATVSPPNDQDDQHQGRGVLWRLNAPRQAVECRSPACTQSVSFVGL